MCTRRSLVIILLCVSLLAGAASAWALAQPASSAPTAPGEQFGRANKGKIEAYVMLLRLGHDLFRRWKDTGKWPDDKEANQARTAHGQYWDKQLKEGRAILAGGMKGDHWATSP